MRCFLCRNVFEALRYCCITCGRRKNFCLKCNGTSSHFLNLSINAFHNFFIATTPPTLNIASHPGKSYPLPSCNFVSQSSGSHLLDHPSHQFEVICEQNEITCEEIPSISWITFMRWLCWLWNWFVVVEVWGSITPVHMLFIFIRAILWDSARLCVTWAVTFLPFARVNRVLSANSQASYLQVSHNRSSYYDF